MRANFVDAHTHTLASGHAYGTVSEMVQAAHDRGLKVLGLTEHGPGTPGACHPIYFVNLQVIPRQQRGVRLLMGAEMNIMDYQGTLDLEPKYIRHLDLRIAGIHNICYTPGSMEENTSALLGAISNPAVDIISHPDDGRVPVDYEAVVAAAQQHHTLLEINNNSMRLKSRVRVRENIGTILTLCKERNHPIIMDSDAHYMDDVGNITFVSALLDEIGFPDDLVLNTQPDAFLAWIEKNRAAERA